MVSDFGIIYVLTVAVKLCIFPISVRIKNTFLLLEEDMSHLRIPAQERRGMSKVKLFL